MQADESVHQGAPMTALWLGESSGWTLIVIREYRTGAIDRDVINH
jgi:hypothetical protein